MKPEAKKWAAGIVCAILTTFATQVSGLTILNFADSHELGFVFAGIPAGDQDVTQYVNKLIGMPLNSFATDFGNSFSRSGNSFGALNTTVLVLPRATYSAYQDFQTDPSTLTLTLNPGYQYLLAKYDGPNSGTEVWYVGDLSGTVSIPTFNGQYGISGSSFFSAEGLAVSDSALTSALLGVALVTFEILRRTRKLAAIQN